MIRWKIIFPCPVQSGPLHRSDQLLLLPWELCADSLVLYIGHQISVICDDLRSLLSQHGLLEWMSDLELVDFGLSCQFLDLSPR